MNFHTYFSFSIFLTTVVKLIFKRWVKIWLIFQIRIACFNQAEVVDSLRNI